MTTPQESVEKDEEFFLLKKCNEICDLSYDYNDSPWLRPKEASKILHEVVAFSAKIAREKAIEEYSQIIHDIVPALGFIDSHRIADPQTLKAYKAVNRFLSL